MSVVFKAEDTWFHRQTAIDSKVPQRSALQKLLVWIKAEGEQFDP